MIAKNDAAHTALSEQFKQRTMEKHYRAVAYGSFAQDEGLIDAPIGRHPIDRKKMAIVADGKPSQNRMARIGAAEWRNVFGCASFDGKDTPNSCSHVVCWTSVARRQNLCA